MRKNLRDARVKAGMRQADVAARLHISIGHYSNIERGEHHGAGYWDALEKLFGVKKHYLKENDPRYRDRRRVTRNA